MTDIQQQPEPAVWLGGTPLLPDAARWRSLAVGAAADLPSMTRVALELRTTMTTLDLSTALRVLVTLAEGNHPVARMVQADGDAVEVLQQVGAPVPDEVMAVFPPEASGVRATPGADGTWRLDGTQARSVHAAAVNRALVLADTDDGPRLFSVALDGPGVVLDRSPLRVIAPEDPNGPVTFTQVPAEPVCDAAWWAARRPTHGGLLRDAAVWLGSCIWLCRTIEATLQTRTEGGDLPRVGRVDVWVYAARLAMRSAVAPLEQDPAGREAELAVRRAAAVVVTTADTVIRLVALLSDARASRHDPLLASRVAQLQIALRRFDNEENLRIIGRVIADGLAARTE